MSHLEPVPERTFTVEIGGSIGSTWHALTLRSAEWWFGNTIRSTWAAGGPMTFHGPDGEPDIHGRILDIEAPRRLVMGFRPVWSDAAAALPEGELAWDLREAEGRTVVTLEHRGLAAGSPMEAEIVDGWRRLLSNLKALVEADAPPRYRAVFDAEVVFSNGGGLQAQGFRVDIPDRDTTAERVGELFVASLDLLMSESITVRNLRVIEEAHKGTRGGPSDPRNAPAGG
jgi:uncharacterized protein YndB with AHSA1/START domain